jgi:hypothetical protein
MMDIIKKSYRKKFASCTGFLSGLLRKWARQDSNLRPTGYEPAALPLSYEPALSAMNGLIFHGNHICVERETGLEPATPCLEGRNSTTELLPQR